jgi:hypothetical protein
VDYVRAVGPEQLLQIHEVLLSDLGQEAMARFLGPDMLSSVPLAVVPVGETVEV